MALDSPCQATLRTDEACGWAPSGQTRTYFLTEAWTRGHVQRSATGNPSGRTGSKGSVPMALGPNESP